MRQPSAPAVLVKPANATIAGITARELERSSISAESVQISLTISFGSLPSRSFSSCFPRKRRHSLLEGVVCCDQKTVLPSEESSSLADNLPKWPVICVVVGCCFVPHGFSFIAAASTPPHGEHPVTALLRLFCKSPCEPVPPVILQTLSFGCISAFFSGIGIYRAMAF
jgi:hypothetical protein